MEGLKFSMGFSKKTEKNILKPGALERTDKKEKISKEIIKSIEDNVIDRLVI